MPSMTRTLLAGSIAGAVLASVAASAFNAPAFAQVSTAESRDGFATCDVLICLERVLDSPEYADAREQTAQPWNDQIQSLVDELNGIRATIEQMEPTDPTAQGLYQQYQSVAQRVNALRQEADVDIDAFAAGQLADAYRVIHAAVQKVGDELGYEQVLATRLSVDDIDAPNTNAMVQEVMMRLVLKSDPADDITDAVIAELNIPEPAPEAPELPDTESGESTGPGGN